MDINFFIYFILSTALSENDYAILSHYAPQLDPHTFMTKPDPQMPSLFELASKNELFFAYLLSATLQNTADPQTLLKILFSQQYASMHTKMIQFFPCWISKEWSVRISALFLELGALQEMFVENMAQYHVLQLIQHDAQKIENLPEQILIMYQENFGVIEQKAKKQLRREIAFHIQKAQTELAAYENLEAITAAFQKTEEAFSIFKKKLFHANAQRQCALASTDESGDSLLHWLFQQPENPTHSILFSLFMEMGCTLQKPINRRGFAPFDLLIQDPIGTIMRDEWLKIAETWLIQSFDTRQKQVPPQPTKTARLFLAIDNHDLAALKKGIEATPNWLLLKNKARVTLWQYALQGINAALYTTRLNVLCLLLERGAPANTQSNDRFLSLLFRFYRKNHAFFEQVKKSQLKTLGGALSARRKALEVIYQIGQKNEFSALKTWSEEFYAKNKMCFQNEVGDTPLHIWIQQCHEDNSEQIFFPLSLARQWFYQYPTSIHLENFKGITPLQMILTGRHHLSPMWYSLMCYNAANNEILSGDFNKVKLYVEMTDKKFLSDITEKRSTLLHTAILADRPDIVSLLLEKGLSPLGAFGLAEKKSEALITILQTYRLDKLKEAIIKKQMDAIKAWIFLEAIHPEFQTVRFKNFYFTPTQLEIFVSVLSQAPYILHLDLSGAFSFDESTIDAILSILKHCRILRTLDLRYTFLTEKFVERCLPLANQHEKLKAILLDHNLLSGTAIKQLKAAHSCHGNLQLPWPDKRQIEKTRYQHPYFETPEDLSDFYTQISALLHRHPVFEDSFNAHPKHPTAIFQTLKQLNDETNREALLSLITPIENMPQAAKANFLLWPIYRFALHTATAWNLNIKQVVTDIKEIFTQTFVQAMSQIENESNQFLENTVKTFLKNPKKSTQQNFFYQWTLQNLAHFKSAAILFPYHTTFLSLLLDNLAAFSLENWANGIKQLYGRKKIFVEQNETLGYALAEYFSEQLLFLDAEKKNNMPSSVEKFALLLASRAIYALPCRAEAAWIEKTIALIRYFPWPQDSLLQTTLQTSISARSLCQQAGFSMAFPHNESFKKVGIDIQMPTWHTETALYGTVPLLSQEVYFFQTVLENNDSEIIPNLSLIKKRYTTFLSTESILPVKNIESRKWAKGALDKIQALEKENEVLIKEVEFWKTEAPTEGNFQTKKEYQSMILEEKENIRHLTEKLNRQKKINEDQSIAIAEKSKMIASQQEDLIKKEEIIATQTQKIKAGKAQNKKLEQSLEEKGEIIVQQQKQLEETTAENQKLKRHLSIKKGGDNQNSFSGSLLGFLSWQIPEKRETESSSGSESTDSEESTPAPGQKQ